MSLGNCFQGSFWLLCFQIHMISMFLIVSWLNLMEYESSVLVLILNFSTLTEYARLKIFASVLVLRRSRQRAESKCFGLPSEMPCSAVQNQAHTGGNGGFQGNSETVMFDSPRPSAKQLAADPFLKTQALQGQISERHDHFAVP